MEKMKFDWAGFFNYFTNLYLLEGALWTLALTVITLFFGLILGLFIAVLRMSKFKSLQMVSHGYVWIFRGTPLLVQLLVGWYVVAAALHVGTGYRTAVGVLVLAMFSGAYMAEIFRGGLDAIPKSQVDSARAIGLTRWQAFRLVIFPQAVRIVLPAVAGQLVSLIKDSSLLSVLSIGEFTFAARNVNSATYSTLESYLPLAAGYLALTLPLSALSRWLERRFRYEAA
jgi:polar amino acid transport system permease protein